jgi:hypothetical protein
MSAFSLAVSIGAIKLINQKLGESPAQHKEMDYAAKPSAKIIPFSPKVPKAAV